MPKRSREVTDYIDAFDEPIHGRLASIRDRILTVVPEADETIKYGMPTYVWHRNLVYFSAFTKHIGMYPLPGKHHEGFERLQPYITSKGTMQFKHCVPLPLDIIELAVVMLRQDLERELLK